MRNQLATNMHGASLRINYKLRNETLETELAAVVWFNNGDTAIRPKVTYAFTDRLKGILGGEIYFPDLRVIAVGDLFTRETPNVDAGAGGSLVGWVAALEQILQLDFDKVIPGSGPVADRADLQRFKSKLDAMVAASQRSAALGTAAAPR